MRIDNVMHHLTTRGGLCKVPLPCPWHSELWGRMCVSAFAAMRVFACAWLQERKKNRSVVFFRWLICSVNFSPHSHVIRLT